MKYIKNILLLLILIIGTGCVNPIKEVPVIKVNISLVEREGIVDIFSEKFTQDNVSYINRPKNTQADSFPAIATRTMITKGNDSIIGQWEMVQYTGSGNYSFNIGFHENHYPVRGDKIHISVIVVDKNGERIGYLVKDIKWK